MILLGKQQNYKYRFWIAGFRFLGRICCLESDSENFNLKGLDLIFYLYKLIKTRTDNNLFYPIVLHLFSNVLNPFFNFIENWIFKGQHIDPFNEFLIDLNYGFINSRDKNYFLKAFNLKERFITEEGDSEYFVIKHLYHDIFECGKSLALLKICAPKHFLCQNKTKYPKIRMSYNVSYLNQIELICAQYYSFVKEKNGDSLRSRKEFIDEKEKREQELLEKMQTEAMERFLQYKRIKNFH